MSAAASRYLSFTMQLPQDKLDLILRRHDEINGRLAANPDAATFVALSRELAGLDSVTAAIREYREQAKELDGIDAIVADLDIENPEALVAVGVPVLGYYSHVDVDTKATADAAGIDKVVPRSRMSRELPDLVAALLA